MKALIRNVLADECKKLILRHYEYLDQLHEGAIRGSKRLGFAVRKTIKTPPYWSLDPRFNPFKTRNKRVLDLCSVTLDKKLKNKSYRPRRAVTYYVEKEDGTKRELNVFQLPDAAVSRLVYKSLLHKNIARLSAYAYAYREDRSAHDAVHAIQAEWRTLDRVYVAEFDFAKFFDNIDHKYIWRVLDRHGFLCSPEERHVLESFLRSESA